MTADIGCITLSTRMSSADDRPKFSNFFQKFLNFSFLFLYLDSASKYIQMGTNKPSIGPIFLEIASVILEKIVNF